MTVSEVLNGLRHELGFAEKEESYVGDCGALHVVIDI